MATKKSATKKAAVKKAAPVKKAPAKKAPVKKAAPVAAKKAAPVKKAPAKKAVKKAASEAPAATKPAPALTTIVADLDVGWGNSLYLRGEGGPLSWDKGIQMDCADGKWTWSTADAEGTLLFKFVLNDKTWAKGENKSVDAGSTAVLRPIF